MGNLGVGYVEEVEGWRLGDLGGLTVRLRKFIN